jgi:hypothetical protein
MERIRDAIPRAFADMDLQAAWKEKARVKKEEGDAKIKEDKKWKDKLDKIEAANKEEFEKFENHDERQLEAHGKIEHEHALTVENWSRTHWRMIQSEKSTSWRMS